MALKIVRKPGRIPFYIRGTINGTRYDESTGTTNKVLAEEYRIKREHELHRQAIHGTAAVATFADAMLHYLEHGGSKTHLLKLLEHLGPMLLSSVKQEQIDAAAKKLYPHAARSTWNRQVYTPTIAVLMHAARLGWCPKPVVKRPATPPPRVRWLRRDEADRLLTACRLPRVPGENSLHSLVLFLLYTGARVGEALWLDWQDVDLERRQVQFINTKNGTSRGVPLHVRVVEELSKVDKKEGSVFLTNKWKPYSRPGPGKDADHSAGTRIKSAFRTACKRAEISDLHPHDCRHTWATWHYMANRNVGALMRLGGWKTMAMVMRYAHTNVDELGDTIDAM